MSFLGDALSLVALMLHVAETVPAALLVRSSTRPSMRLA
jgi:hypothetical protein